MDGPQRDVEVERVPARTQWEPRIGYSRAIRAGSAVYVSGTVALDEAGQIVGRGDAYEQTRCVLRHIEAALGELGYGMAQIIRTRVYLTRMGDWEEVARAYSEVFGAIKPVSSWVEVSQLIHPEAIVEIEADGLTSQ